MLGTKSTRLILGVIAGLLLLLVLVVVYGLLKSSLPTLSPYDYPVTTPTPVVDGWQVYEASLYEHSFSFSYPPGYKVSKGGRPFNVNNEGFSTSYSLDCNSRELCPDDIVGSFSVTVYENRQDWSLEDWLVQSVYAPQHDCSSKDARASITPGDFLDRTAYVFTYVSDENGSLGCANLSVSGDKGDGSEFIFRHDQQVYRISMLTNDDQKQAQLDQIAASFSFIN